MISRFLCFSKAYLCRGQSSPKRRWIVVASWRQLWRRPWRRRFGIVKRTLCVCVCVVCVCCVCVCVVMRLKVRHRGTAYGVFFSFLCPRHSQRRRRRATEHHTFSLPLPLSLSLSLSLFFSFFFSLSFFLQCPMSKGCRKVFLSSLSRSCLLSFTNNRKNKEQEREQRHK